MNELLTREILWLSQEFIAAAKSAEYLEFGLYSGIISPFSVVLDSGGLRPFEINRIFRH